MKKMDLENNALFLAGWHERSRPLPLVCIGIVILCVFLLAYLSMVMAGRPPAETVQGMFSVIVFVQFFVLLAQGSYFVWQMAARERIFGTLDFHRSSPETIKTKAMGLILGAAWFEWLIFSVLMLCELPFALHDKISLDSIFMLNLSLVLAGIFLHAVTATLSLMLTRKGLGASPLAIIIVIMLLGPASAMFLKGNALLMYLFGVTSLSYVMPEGIGLSGYFLSWKMSPFLMQAFVQLPFILFCYNGLERIFCQPNSPVWPKKDIVLLGVFLLALNMAFSLTEIWHPVSKTWHAGTLNSLTVASAAFLGFYLMAGVAIGWVLVPAYFSFARAKVLKLKKKTGVEAYLNDGSSAVGAMLVYALAGLVIFEPYIIESGIFWLDGVFCFVLISAYLLAFTGYLEYFRLSRFRHQKMFFVTGLAVWWIFLPWLFGLLFGFNERGMLAALSPFTCSSWVMGVLSGHKVSFGGLDMVLPSVLIAFLIWSLAGIESQVVEKKIAAGLAGEDDRAGAV